MKIYTHTPLLQNQQQIIKNISKFWDKLSHSWNKIWGEHIHHGFYEDATDDPLKAQNALVDRLVGIVQLEPKTKILDLGCGIGGSSRILAQKYEGCVTGVSLSKKQIQIAKQKSNSTGAHKIQYRVDDAHHLSSFTDKSFDLIWSLESCEQFYDKEKCIQQAHRVLKPKGKLLIATWCADQKFFVGEFAKRYRNLCKTFDLPYMPTIQEYSRILDKYFNRIAIEDWTNKVKKSWEDGIAELNNHSWLKLLCLSGFTGLRFVKGLHSMREAFNCGQLRYGVFLYQKK